MAISAAIDAEGRLIPVGGLWPKLQAVAEEHARLGALRTVIVAEGQKDVPPHLLAPEASPLRVHRAATLSHALTILAQEALPRQEVARRVARTMPLFQGEVPLGSHYQMLPLLRPVPRERLPRIAERGEGAEDDWAPLRLLEIRHWEEQLQQEPTSYEPVALEQVLHNFAGVTQTSEQSAPRFIVLGPPGSGKSTLLRYLAWWCVRHPEPLRIGNLPLIPAYVPLREWEAWARKEREPNYHLPDYLAEQYKHADHPPTAAQWREWLRHGAVFLLLDGLDEIAGDPSFVEQGLKGLLHMTGWAGCPLILKS